MPMKTCEIATILRYAVPWAITDLAGLWDYVRAHAHELDTDTAPLTELLAARTKTKLETVLGGAAPFFAPEPAAFAAGILGPSEPPGSSSAPASPE